MLSKITRRPLLFLCLLFFVSHIFNLTLLPVFMDEANYLDWGWREVHDGVPYHSLYDGKQPFLMWIYGMLQTIPVNPLWITRFFSLFTGLAVLAGIYLIAKNLFDSKIAFLSALLYTFTPLFFFYDRQALMESSMAAVSVWTFYFLLRLYHRPRILYVVASGAILGIGYFIKSTALVFLAQFIFLYFFFLTLRRREPIRYINLFLIFLSAFILVNLPLFFRAQFWATLPMSVRYSFSLAELSKLPFPQWFTNLRIMLDLILVNLTPPLLIAFLIGSYLLLRRRKFTLLTLILWVVLSLIHTVIFARSVNFRYLEPYLPLTVIPAAFVLVSRRALAAVTLGIGGAVCLLQTVSPPDYFRFMSHITRYSYIEGYVTGDSTGYQVMESVKYFEKLAQKQPIIIGIALNVGNPEGALLVFLRRNPNIVMTYMDAQMLGGVTKNFDCLTSQTPLYFLAREKQQAGLDKFFTPVATITNSYNSDYHTVYTLNPDCTGKTFPIALTKH